jgi:drug/metabolite transporter (DMT)-like permease
MFADQSERQGRPTDIEIDPAASWGGCRAADGRTIDVVALLGGCLMWGLAWWPMKALDDRGLNGPALAIIGYAAAAFCLLPAVLRHRVVARATWQPVLAIAITGGIWNVTYMTAMIDGHASRVVLLYYLSSGWAIIGGRLWFRETIDRCRGAAVLLVFTGACLVLGRPALSLDALSTPDLLAITAGMAHAATNLMYRATAHVPLSLRNFATFGGAVLAATLVLEGGPSSLSLIPIALIFAGAAFGVGWLLLADTLTQHGVSRLPATRSSVLLIAELPITVASAAILAGERLGPIELIGGSLIVMATLIEVLRPSDIPVIAKATQRRVLHAHHTARFRHRAAH